MPDAALYLVILTALLFEFINGFHDTANAVAASVYTHALSARQAVCLAAVMNFCGALASERVARTIASGLIAIPLQQYVILAALLGAIAWNLITWYFAFPSSSSHALIGSLLGAAAVYGAAGHILWGGVLIKVVIPLLTSPQLGFLVGFLLMKLLFVLFAGWPQRRVNRLFIKLQIISASFIAYSHGKNDAQKSMGIITLALVGGGLLGAEAGVPLWVKIACACMIALGTSVGGQRIMKTMGSKITRMTPSGSFAAQTASALVIEAMSLTGAPVSTTQLVTASIVGAGTAKRRFAVKWGVTRGIISAWLVTLPLSMLLGGAICFLLQLLL